MKQILLYLLLFSLNIFSQDGSLDTSFNPNDVGFGSGGSPNDRVRSIAIQNDGKALIAGNFTSYNELTSNRITRLNIDGSLDTSFSSGTGPNSEISLIEVQDDGKIIILGFFTSYNGIPSNRIARLNSDGSLDTSFSFGSGSSISTIAIQNDGKILVARSTNIFRLNIDGSLDTDFNSGSLAASSIRKIVILDDGKILIGGTFTSYNGIESNHIARLNSDGTLDTSFSSGTGVDAAANTAINIIETQDDGKIVVSGNFTSYNGIPSNSIARLNSDGSLDSNFNSGMGPDNSVSSIVIQDDEKILIGGSFSNYNGIESNRIARLNNDGSLDSNFNSGIGPNNSVFKISIQDDGKILTGGNFLTYNELSIRNIARLNSDGSLDINFNASTGANNTVNTVKIQDDEKILIGGSFSNYNGTESNRLARINSDGSLDISFSSGTGSNSRILRMELQDDDKIIISGNFTEYNGITTNNIARLNNNGSLDTSFNSGSGVGTSFSTPLIGPIAIQDDGKILIGGSFTTYNGTEINRLARLNSDGSLDTSFNIGVGFDNTVDIITIQDDGRILISGEFTSYNGATSNDLVRLNSDGSLDTNFNTGTGVNNSVFTSTIQDDGKIIIAGNFTSYNGIESNKIARLNSDGSLDTSFSSSLGSNFSIFILDIQDDGKILASGDFTSFNGIPSNDIVRLNSNGSLDTSFNTGTGVNTFISTLAIQDDGNIIIVGGFTSYDDIGRNRIARLNATNSLSVEEINLFDFKLYPNPTNNQFTIQLTNNSTLKNLNIYNNLGQLVLSSKEITIDTSQFNSGLYIVEIETSKGKSSKKLIIQ
ncbi:T9SS type A sorting domain-containing protein [uncultured Winogradskyella sp.]|uniref:T9SS type A sorting domain-containing protein n=1 Tax=uncultured Winogradskyella sp. TaxID=395353 RepID=UPI002637BF56|nr:T9SS type A sorting domain-containing protein [uncultured Winogradskyella sp.]